MFEYLSARLACWYPSNTDIRSAWKEGKDFYSYTHRQYFSIRDSESLQKDGYIGAMVGNLYIKF